MNVVFSCRELLEEGRATVPCLAERLTSELIMHICVSVRRAEQSLASAKLNHVDTHGSPGHLVKMWAQIQGCGCGLGCSQGVWLLPVRGPLVEWDADKLPTRPTL